MDRYDDDGYGDWKRDQQKDDLIQRDAAMRERAEKAEAEAADLRQWRDDAVASCARRECATKDRRLSEAEAERDEAQAENAALRKALADLVAECGYVCKAYEIEEDEHDVAADFVAALAAARALLKGGDDEA